MKDDPVTTKPLPPDMIGSVWQYENRRGTRFKVVGVQGRNVMIARPFGKHGQWLPMSGVEPWDYYRSYRRVKS